MASAIDHSSYGSRRRRDDEESFGLKEWDSKARVLSREHPNSRRYSASYIRSFREDPKSIRSNVTISSTASSPGYPLKDEIDPSTYSFSTALKALQAKAGYNNWDWLTADGLALNSKWNDAEKYICNPESGEVPMECLSAKTLSGRYFRQYLTNRIAMSAPLVYPATTPHPLRQALQMKPPVKVVQEDLNYKVPLQEKRVDVTKRDVGIQSTPAELSSGSLSPARTPPIAERSLKRYEPQAAVTILKIKPRGHEEVKVVEKKGSEGHVSAEEGEGKKMAKNKKESRGCLSWVRSMKQREIRPKPRRSIFPTC